jgi:sterol desaturase/sphingolipid hydroxylase (fatty acid hydroxylase superfamily)
MSLIYLGATTLLLIALEQIPQLRFRSSQFFRLYFASDVVYLLTGYLAVASISVAYIVGGSNLIGTTLGVPGLARLNLPIWISVPMALVALDFGQYVAHYLMHRYDWLWEFHKIHHSSVTVDWLATFRSHLVEQILRRILGPLMLIVAGFPVNASLIASGIFIAWAEFNHANLKVNLGFMESVLISPRLHKVHHVPRTSESNLGTIFTFWDRIRGTLVSGALNQEAVFGNGERDYPQTWTRQLLRPLRRVLPTRLAANRVSGP